MNKYQRGREEGRWGRRRAKHREIEIELEVERIKDQDG